MRYVVISIISTLTHGIIVHHATELNDYWIIPVAFASCFFLFAFDLTSVHFFLKSFQSLSGPPADLNSSTHFFQYLSFLCSTFEKRKNKTKINTTWKQNVQCQKMNFLYGQQYLYSNLFIIMYVLCQASNIPKYQNKYSVSNA